MLNRIDALLEIEEKICVTFKDKEIFDIALTHSSFANQKKNIKYNERLEFLGDSVLQLCVTDYLFKNLKEEYEGEMTKYRALIVCESSLFEIAQKWDLGKYIKMSKGEELTGGRNRTSILADCVEAIIAAIYIDGGYEIAKTFILKYFEPIISKATKKEILFDFKTKLQELFQHNGDTNISYDMIKFEGPPHRRRFYTSVLIGNSIRGTGIGFSKKESEQNAAKAALDNIHIEKENKIE